ncbi:MAG: TolC family protein [Candidatus Eremiobacterota bacterium]
MRVWILVGWLSLAGQPTLSLEQAVEEALLHHPSLERLAELRMAAAARVGQAESAALPQLTLEAVVREGPTSGLALGFAGLSNSTLVDNLGADLVVSQTLLDFGRRSHLAAGRRLEEEAARWDEASQRSRLWLEVHRAFLQALLARRLVELSEQQVELGQTLLRLASARYRAGLVSRLDEELARAGVGESQARLAEARRQEKEARAQLGALLGHPVEGDLAEPESNSESRPTTRPDAEALSLRLQAQEEAVQAAAAEGRPVLRLLATAGTLRVAPEQRAVNHHYAVGLALVWPVYTGGRVEAEEDEQRHRLNALRAQRKELEQSTLLEIERARLWVESLEAARAGVELQQQAAEDGCRLARKRYEVGLGTLVEVQQAQLALLVARTRVQQLHYEGFLARAALQHAMGVTP